MLGWIGKKYVRKEKKYEKKAKRIKIVCANWKVQLFLYGLLHTHISKISVKCQRRQSKWFDTG